MPTYFDIQNRINQDYLNRTDKQAETRRAIQASVRYYERERWPWNEATLTLTAVASQTYVSIPPDFLILDKLQFTNASADYSLRQRPFEDILTLRVVRTTSFWPTDFALRADKFELFPIPNSAYTLPCHYLKQLAPLSADTDTNKWLSCAEDLVVFHATALMWSTVFRNMEAAAPFAQLEETALRKLQGYRDQTYAHTLRPTQF